MLAETLGTHLEGFRCQPLKGAETAMVPWSLSLGYQLLSKPTADSPRHLNAVWLLESVRAELSTNVRLP